MKHLVTGMIVVAGALALPACSSGENATANGAETTAINEAELDGGNLSGDGLTAVDGVEANGVDLNAAADAELNAAGNAAEADGNRS